MKERLNEALFWALASSWAVFGSWIILVTR